jgi:uncharacterized protein with ATP-grasp and redox domains
MQTFPDCMPCLLRQGLTALRLCGVEEEQIFSILKQTLRCAADFDISLSPPEMAMYIHRIIREQSGNNDPYREIKHQAIKEVLLHEKRIRSIILASENRFRTAVRFALAGNVLDFAIFEWNPEKFAEQLDATLYKSLDERALSRLEEAVEQANTIMVIGDNAGESVFDKLLIEQLPAHRVIYAVRGSPAINDVTYVDALASGLDNVAALVDNGSDAPGTLLKHVSKTFLHDFNIADLIIAKGQGNYESLCDCNKNIFFLTQIKCPVIARDLNGVVGDWVVAENGVK